MRHFKAFSLIEVILAGAMVVTTAGALFAVATMSIRLTVQSQDRLVAGELAREGIEVVRQVRDRNFISTICSSGPGCPEWSSGIQTVSSGPQAKSITPNAQVGFNLSDAPLSANAPCSDYIVRSLDESASQVFRSVSQLPTLAEGEQLYCRRLIVEFIDLPDTTIDDAAEKQAMRVRSQVAWTGFGKTVLRDPTSGSPECQSGGSEWCVEEVAIFTNWRPSL
jgi:type II secretory pathway pseudopilin PulG